MNKRKPELLAPAGDMERLKMAVLYGADAVYLAGTSFGMRSFAGNFSPQELPEAVRYAHSHGVKVHVTVNTMPRSGELDALPELCDFADRLEKATVDTIESGIMTGDLYLLSSLENKRKVNTEQFLEAVVATLEKGLKG